MAITVQFGGQKNSNQAVTVKADPFGYIAESNEYDNSATVTITGNKNGGTTGNGSYDEDDDADLVITLLEVGRLSGNRFSEDDDIDEDDDAAVRFIVKNQGGESTGSWKFEITNLPYDSNDSYRSKSYSSLRPGESIEIVADFDGINDGRYNIRVEVDSEDDVDEENERNNTESETLEVSR
jgi:subtilase family serine protease